MVIFIDVCGCVPGSLKLIKGYIFIYIYIWYMASQNEGPWVLPKILV